MNNPDRDELRIALSMRGGVSLAVWIGGAVQELDRLTRARPLAAGGPLGDGDDFYSALLTLGGYERAVLDVITGASAGGLNGVVLAASRAYGFEFSRMLPLWVRLGDIELLSRDPVRVYDDPVRGRTRRPASLLQGNEYFQARLGEELRTLIGAGDPAHAVTDGFDLILSATLVNPLYVTTDEDPFAPLPEVRRSASFHFRYLGELGAYGGDFQTVPIAADPAATSTSSLLALAGRSTSSFPVAFEPAGVGREAARVFSDPPGRDEPPRRVLDGGVLDNIPVTKAIEAIAAASVERRADRWLVFLHPSPSDSTKQGVQARGLADPGALRTLIVTGTTAFGQESLLDDLAELQRHNSLAAEQRWRRAALLADFDPSDRLPDEVVAASRRARAHLDASRAVKVALGQLRVRRPVTEGSDRVRSTEWLRAVRNRVADDIDDAYREAYELRDLRADAPSSEEASAVLSPGGLLIGCDIAGQLVRATRAASVDDSPVLTACLAQVKALRALAGLARNWADQAWLVAASDGPEPSEAWAATAARSALSSWRSVPDDAFSSLAMCMPWVGESPDLPTDGFAEALGLLDDRMRSIVGALAEVDSGQDLGTWAWRRLAAVTVACGREVRPTTTWTAIVDRDDPHRAAVGHLLRAALRHQPLDEMLPRVVTVSTQAQSADLASDDEIRFVRITGNNETPLRSCFVDDGEPFGVDQKLCGNALGNFAAFFSATWRANDWMWGRLDAVKSIVDLIVRPERIRMAAMPADDMAALVGRVCTGLGSPVDEATMAALRIEIAIAKEEDDEARTDRLTLCRSLLTAAMQRRLFAEMQPTIDAVGERPHWPEAAVAAGTQSVATKAGAATAPAAGTDAGADASTAAVDRMMRDYHVGSQTLADLDSRRRTQIGMRLAMVGYQAFQPSDRNLGARVGRLAVSILKPFYLFAVFASLNLARAMFLVNVTAVGFWIGPWRYRADRSDETASWHDLTIGDWRWPGRRWVAPIAPTSWASWLGFALVVSLSAASLALYARTMRRRARARRRHRRPPLGHGWYLASGIGGIAALLFSSTTGVTSGPLGVVLGATSVALLTCLWMRPWKAWFWIPIGTATAYVLTGLAFWVFSHRQHEDWFPYIGWMSVVALYAAQVVIALFCTYTTVLYRESELQAHAARPHQKRWYSPIQSSV